MSAVNSKWIWLAGTVALASGFLFALGCLAAPPVPGDMLMAARGISSEGAGLIDRAAAAIWREGGAGGLALARWLIVFVSASALSFVLLWYSRRLRRRPRLYLWLALGFVALVVAGRGLLNWNRDRTDLRLSIPLELVEAIPADRGEVYTNPSARQALALLGDARGISPPSIDSATRCQSPAEWRVAMRERGWTGAMLVGPLQEYRPLLDHLLTSPDWRLDRVANSGWLFLREAGADSELPEVEDIELTSPRETALYLAQLSDRFEAMGETPRAREAIERALELAPRNPTVLLHAARFAVARSRWGDVISRCNAAIRHGARGSVPHSLRAHALLESGNLDAARQAAETALRAAPRDLETLFLLARIFRAQNDFGAEAESLEKAVTAARDAGLPEAGYLVFLGQSYARVGNASEAASAYRKALSSGQLPAAQAQAVREALDTVEARSMD